MNIIAFIDFEATALSSSADVIEVGLSIFDGDMTISTWSSLVRPSPTCVWSSNAAKVHKISRTDLQTAESPRWIAAELNRFMTRAGLITAFCDGLPFDAVWMANLFHDGGITPVFDLTPTNMLSLKTAGELNRYLTYLRQGHPPHRAGPDSLRLAQAFAYATRQKANVVALT